MEHAPTYGNALPLGSMLLEYRLESILGAGGFGITYLGWDTNLEKHVAIKEYLPGSLAMRALDGSVVPVNTDHKYNYQWGLDRFIQEARTLAKFSHPNIVRVNRFFEANNTSYMVMDYEAGESLHQHLRRHHEPDEATLKRILLPIIDGLEAVHRAGFLHRDIKPSNVFIRENGAPLLLDFGAARMNKGDSSKSLTAIVSAGYAPLEQYSSDGHQGPWSDIYALAGVMYRAVTKKDPPDAVKRTQIDDVSKVLTAAGSRFSGRFLTAIERGLAVDEKLRPHSIDEWRAMFLAPTPHVASGKSHAVTDVARTKTTVRAEPQPPGASPAAIAHTRSAGPPVTPPAGPPEAPPAGPSVQPASAPTAGKGGFTKWLLAGLVLIIVALGVIWSQRKPAQTPVPSGPATSANQPGARTDLPPPKPLAQTDVPLSVRKEFVGADDDANGYLTPQEVKDRFPFIERSFALVDSDKDGRISAEEFWQLRRKQQGVRKGP